MNFLLKQAFERAHQQLQSGVNFSQAVKDNFPDEEQARAFIRNIPARELSQYFANSDQPLADIVARRLGELSSFGRVAHRYLSASAEYKNTVTEKSICAYFGKILVASLEDAETMVRMEQKPLALVLEESLNYYLAYLPSPDNRNQVRGQLIMHQFK